MIKIFIFIAGLFFSTCSLTMNIDSKSKLVENAVIAAKQTYSPYSKYPVGAALLTEDGTIIRGTNVENASFGLTNCAERSAVFSAVSNGHKKFTAMAVATRDGGMPCGACRQVLNEFNPLLDIIIVDMTGKIVTETTLGKLLPDAFGPQKL